MKLRLFLAHIMIALGFCFVSPACVDLPDPAQESRFRCTVNDDCIENYRCGALGFCESIDASMNVPSLQKDTSDAGTSNIDAGSTNSSKPHCQELDSCCSSHSNGSIRSACESSVQDNNNDLCGNRLCNVACTHSPCRAAATAFGCVLENCP